MSDDDVIFFPSDHLKGLFQDIRSEFDEQVEDLLQSPMANADDTLPVSRDLFSEGFDTHIHRYQQFFVLLRDIGLLKNSLLEMTFLSALITPEYSGNLKVPVINQYDDFMYVGFEETPVDMGSIEERDTITIATVPLLPDDPLPYEGKSVLVTTVDEETEVAVVSHDRNRNRVIIMWGNYVVDEINRQTPVDPSTLN